jgi:hypothetical protein
MAAVSTRDVYASASSGHDVRTGSRSDHNTSRRDVSWRGGGGHSMSTADVSAAAASTDVSTTTAMSSATMSATAATMAPALRGSIGDE